MFAFLMGNPGYLDWSFLTAAARAIPDADRLAAPS